MAYLAERGDRIGLVRRPDKGLLGGMLALPSPEWGSSPVSDPLAGAPFAADWRDMGRIEHVFTHFSLTLRVMAAQAPAGDHGLIWLPLQEASAALPSVFLKAFRAGTGGSLL